MDFGSIFFQSCALSIGHLPITFEFTFLSSAVNLCSADVLIDYIAPCGELVRTTTRIKLYIQVKLSGPGPRNLVSVTNANSRYESRLLTSNRCENAVCTRRRLVQLLKIGHIHNAHLLVEFFSLDVFFRHNVSISTHFEAYNSSVWMIVESFDENRIPLFHLITHVWNEVSFEFVWCCQKFNPILSLIWMELLVFDPRFSTLPFGVL